MAVELEGALAFALGLAERAEAFTLALDLPELDPVELPPIVGDEHDQARLRRIAPLYLAAELERAGLLPAAEALAGIFVSGGLQSDLGAAAELLLAFWRARHERFAREERRAFFARLFGGDTRTTLSLRAPVNAEFEPLLAELAVTLDALGAPMSFRSLPGTDVAVRAAALRLAENATSRTTGIPEPAARTILEAIAAALALFKAREVQAALGVASTWAAVREASRRYRRSESDITAHVQRGKAGLTIMAWLAEAVGTLDGSRALLAPGPEVIGAAGAWLQASRSVVEGGARAAA